MNIALTGAAAGIGAAVADKLQSSGATIVAFDLIEPKTVDHWIQVDLSSASALNEATEYASQYGPYDALINCAGLPPGDGLEARILAVNFIGLRLFTETMIAKLNHGASIVNVASRAGSHWRDNLDRIKALMACRGFSEIEGFLEQHTIDPVQAYNLSKEAVIVWTKAETVQLIARGIRMNSVSPAAVETRILGDFMRAFGARAEQGIARAGRAAMPSEIAELIVFLASSKSAWIKGADIAIDGGISAMADCDLFEIA